jgi:hypothetical protein
MVPHNIDIAYTVQYRINISYGIIYGDINNINHIYRGIVSH